MAEKETVYRLKFDINDTSTEEQRKKLELLKKAIIETENEVKALKTETKGNAQAQVDAAGKFSQLETKLFKLKSSYGEVRREAAGVKGFTDKIGDSFAKSLGPIQGMLGALGPIGQQLSGLGGKLGGIQASLSGLGKASTDAGGGLGKLGGFSSILSKGISGSVLAIGGLVAGLGALGVGLVSSVQAYDESIKAQTSLKTALGFTSNALLAQADALQKTTGFQDDAITKAQAFAASLGLTEKQILDLTPAVLDLAAATGESVDSAFEKVATTLSGGKDALKKYGIELDSSATLQERVGQVVDGLGSKFAGQAEAIASVGSGPIQKFQNNINDLEENIGRLVTSAINPFVEGLGDIVSGFSDLLEPAENIADVIAEGTKGLRDQQNEYTNLILKLQDANTKEEDRAKIIKTLNTQYKEYLPQLITEKTSNEELTTALVKGNEAFIKRIALRSQEVVLEDALNKQGNALAEKTKAELALKNVLVARITASKSLTASEKEQQISLLQSEAGIKKLIATYGQADDIIRRTQGNTKDIAIRITTNGVDDAASKYQDANKIFKETEIAVANASKSVDEVAKALGLSGDAVVENTENLTDYQTTINELSESVKNGSASLDDYNKYIQAIKKSSSEGGKSASKLGEQLKDLGTAIDNLPSDKKYDAIRNILISEQKVLENEIKSLRGDSASGSGSSNKKVEKSYEERVAAIAKSLDEELAIIDEQENRKLLTINEAEKKRNEAQIASFNERIDVEKKNVDQKGFIIPISIEKIAGLEEEKAKLQAWIKDIDVEINNELVEKQRRIDVELSLSNANIEKQVQDALALDTVKTELEDILLPVANTFGLEFKDQIIQAVKDGTVDFASLENAGVPVKIIDDIKESYFKLFRATENNKLEFVRSEALTKLKQIDEKIAGLNNKKVNVSVGISTEPFTEEDQKNLDKLVDEKTYQSIIVLKTENEQKKNETVDPFKKDDTKLGLSDDDFNNILETYDQLNSAINDVFFQAQEERIQSMLDRDVRSLEENYQTQNDLLKASLDQNLITQSEYEQQRKENQSDLNAQRFKLESDAFKKEQKIRKAEATLNYFGEISNLAFQYSKLPPGVGQVLAAIQIAVATARYAGNIAQIQNAVPPTAERGAIIEFKSGGVNNHYSSTSNSTYGGNQSYNSNSSNQRAVNYSYGGVPIGPRHSDGGIKVLVGGEQAVEMEGGEAVINRKSTALFRPLLSQINSYGGFGRKFATGGVMPSEPISLQPSPELFGIARRDTINIASEQVQQQVVLYISELENKQSRINRTKDRVSFG